MSNQPYLEKYSGRKSRHECPACHDKHSFTYYLNGDTGQVIDKAVGRCDHESGCGYHYTPKEYRRDNPGQFPESIKKRRNLKKPDKLNVITTVKSNAMENNGETTDKPTANRRIAGITKEQGPGRIPKQYLIQSLGYDSNLVAFLCSIFDRYILESPTIERLISYYYLGCTKNGSVIYWQLDTKKRIRTGKIMQYDPATGKRIKNATGAIDWIHAKLKRDNILTEDFNLVQCLFGEHLLPKYPDKIVALVEAEKSALIGAGVYPEYLWLATGGRSQLSIDKFQVLRGRTVIMFPDTDTDDKTYSLWCEKAKELEGMGCTVTVSDLLEQMATDEDRASGLDIADYLIHQLKATVPESEHRPSSTPSSQPTSERTSVTTHHPQLSTLMTTEEKALAYLGNLNPNIYTLIDALELVSITTSEEADAQIN